MQTRFFRFMLAVVMVVLMWYVGRRIYSDLLIPEIENRVSSVNEALFHEE